VVEVQIYDVLVRNTGVVEVVGDVIDLDDLVEVVVDQVEGGSLVGQKFEKFTGDIKASSGS